MPIYSSEGGKVRRDDRRDKPVGTPASLNDRVWPHIAADQTETLDPFAFTPELLDEVKRLFANDEGMREIAQTDPVSFRNLLEQKITIFRFTAERILELMDADEAAKQEVRPILQNQVDIRNLFIKVARLHATVTLKPY